MTILSVTQQLLPIFVMAATGFYIANVQTRREVIRYWKMALFYGFVLLANIAAFVAIRGDLVPRAPQGTDAGILGSSVGWIEAVILIGVMSSAAGLGLIWGLAKGQDIKEEPESSSPP